jgi:uncharacterized protein
MLNDLLLFGVGILVGGMNAIAGGGMILGFPVLLATGMSPLVATATTNIVTAPGLAGAIFGYRKYLKTIPKRFLILLLPCFAGSAIGAYLLVNTPAESFEQYVPALLAFAVILFTVQPFIHIHFHRHLSKRTQRLLPIVLMSLFLFPLSIYGGYFGVGFGFALLAFFGFTKLHDIHKINAIKNIAALVISTTALLILLDSTLIDWRHGLVMSAGCLIGGFYGAHLAQRVTSHIIRIVVIGLGVSAVVFLAAQTY